MASHWRSEEEGPLGENAGFLLLLLRRVASARTSSGRRFASGAIRRRREVEAKSVFRSSGGDRKASAHGRIEPTCSASDRDSMVCILRFEKFVMNHSEKDLMRAFHPLPF